MRLFSFRKKYFWKSLAFAFFSILFFQCQTYYNRNIDYHQKLQAHDYQAADKSLDKFKLLHKDRNSLLLLLEKGKVAHLQKEYTESNLYFNEADLLIEDYNKAAKDYLVSATLNAQLSVYRAEGFEKILIHYYKALNYLFLNNFEAALVEARRIDLGLHQLDDKYKKTKNKYAQDAFAHILMGLIYEASNDMGNAFIAYRNALNVYTSAEGSYMNVSLPEQLKKDVIRCAYLNGYTSIQKEYEQKFNIKFDKKDLSRQDLVLFWENGLSPVKEEWSINFTVLPGKSGYVTFVNDDLNLSFPFLLDPSNNLQVSDFKMIRVSFPKYTDRLSLYTDLTVHLGNQNYKTELIEDLNTIARRTLKDRFAEEIAVALSRLVVKQTAELVMQKENKDLGTTMSLFNSLSEKADTRQWQSLPNHISYVRIPIKDEKEFSISLQSTYGQVNKQTFSVSTNENPITFMNIHSLEASFP